MNFNEKYSKLKDLFEENLYKFLDTIDGEKNLVDSMKYSVLAGGKRIRPVIMLAISEILGIKESEIMPFAIAVELIHTYSLIHDDLPCMDNDDYRRGKPTNHKVYGEGVALLAGDALLNLAYEICFRNSLDITKLNASRLISTFCGYRGMIGGQALDIKSESAKIDTETLLKIHEGKTVKMFMVACLVPSCLCGDVYMSNLREYAYNLGYLFQITDDILDVTSQREVLGKTINKDASFGKLTYVTAYGLDGAIKKSKEYHLRAVNSIKDIKGSDFLVMLADYVLDRKN